MIRENSVAPIQKSVCKGLTTRTVAHAAEELQEAVVLPVPTIWSARRATMIAASEKDETDICLMRARL